jgi:SNF2 family DNA or RNA helicase
VSIHVSARHKIVGVPRTTQLANLFPHARTIDINGLQQLLLPHGLRETVVLRSMGLDVPAPILTQYDFPGDKKPFRVQLMTAALFSTSQRCYCLNGMGTGKTKAALWAFDYLKGMGHAKRALVIAPLSILDNVWRSEAFRTVPHLSVGVLHGDRKKRLRILDEDHDLYVINPDGIRVIEKELLRKIRTKAIDTMVIDEIAIFRNATSERNKCARRLAEHIPFVWGLTGSPCPDEPTDAYGQCKIVTPHTVPKFFTRFRDELMTKVTSFKYAAKKDAMDKVFAAMQPAVRYTLDDVHELPPLIERVVDIPLGVKQEKVYEAMRIHAHTLAEKHEITAVNAGAVYNKLLQISIGSVYTNTRKVVHLDADARLDQMVTDIQACNEKVIVFVPFTHCLQLARDRLLKEGIECAMVDGSVPKRQRDHIFTLFQNTSKFKVIVAHPGTMAHGLTLTAATLIIWYGPTTSLETFEQANARIRRVGQTKKQLVLMYQGTPIERRTYTRLRAKQKVQDGILQMFAEASI